MISFHQGFSQETEALGESATESGYSVAQPRVRLAGTDASKFLFSHGDPTVFEQLMLELVNRARANPGAEAARLGIGLNDGLAAGAIQDTPKQPVAFHPRLIQAARVHSQWMLDADVFSHTGADNSSPGTRMTDAGYVFSGSWTWGENIAWGGTTGTPDLLAQTLARHDSLFRSAGHRQNICNGSFDEVGLGILAGQFTTTRVWNAAMVTQDFAKSAWSVGPLLVGVVFVDSDGDGLYDPSEGAPGVTVSPEGSDWYAVTSTSGGYAVPYTGSSGVLNVEFSGGLLAAPAARTITRNGSNLKLDLVVAVAANTRFLDGSFTFSSAAGMTMQVTGPLGSQFELQHSTDLQNWTTVGTHTLTNLVQQFSHQPGPGAGRGYYRLRNN